MSNLSPRNYRYPGEILSLAAIHVLLVGLYTVLIKWGLGDSEARLKALAITAAGLAVYSTTVFLQQRSVFGSLVRVSERQFPEIYQLGVAAARRLGTKPLPIYIKRSSEQNIYAIGRWRKSVIVIHSSMIDQMAPENLQFFIGREIGHVVCGHSVLRAMLKPMGSEVPIVGKLLNSVIFGDWLNRSEFTADRAGFIACDSLTAAVSAMLKFGVGVKLFEKLDIREFLDQIHEVSSVGGKMTEIVTEQPYLTKRVRLLSQFAISENFQSMVPSEHAHSLILDAMPKTFLSLKKIQPKPQQIPVKEIIPQAPRIDNEPDPLCLLISLRDNKTHLLRSKLTKIGRNEDNDVQLQGDRASRYHAEIVREGKAYLLVDNNSINGVYLNGDRVQTKAPLKNDDRIRIGDEEFYLKLGRST